MTNKLDFAMLGSTCEPGRVPHRMQCSTLIFCKQYCELVLANTTCLHSMSHDIGHHHGIYNDIIKIAITIRCHTPILAHVYQEKYVTIYALSSNYPITIVCPLYMWSHLTVYTFFMWTPCILFISLFTPHKPMFATLTPHGT